MGILLKVVLFGLVFYYILKTVGGFIFRLLGGQSPQQQQRYRQAQQQQQKREGDINIDYMPKNKRGKTKNGSKDGDYIDYEEVK